MGVGAGASLACRSALARDRGDGVAAICGHIRFRVCWASGFRPLRPTHFAFAQSKQRHCSGLGPCGLPSFRRRSTGPHRRAVHGPSALARRPASLPGSASPAFGLRQRRDWRRLCDWGRKAKAKAKRSEALASDLDLDLLHKWHRRRQSRRWCRPSGGVVQGETRQEPSQRCGREAVATRAPGATPEGGNPACRRDYPEQWLCPLLAETKVGRP